ncbi:MAG: hypothetical protein WCW35_01905 [Bacteroidota bacterium]|jgi:hypothetical protein
MEHNVGVWIDCHKAVIVRLTDVGHEIRSVIANEETDVNDGGTNSEDLLKYNSASHLNAYYERIVSALHGAESVLILGPGEEKVELSVRLPGNTLGEHIAGIVTAPEMSDDQVAAKVCRHFQ